MIETQESGRAHHRQDRPARQPRRPRSLPPVHGRGAADLRPPDGRRLRGRRRAATRASTRCAARWRCARTRRFTARYFDPDKRYIGNAVQVFFKDGTATERVQVDVPIGHRKRRAEGMPLLVKKFEASVAAHFSPCRARRSRRCSRTARSSRRCRSTSSSRRWSRTADVSGNYHRTAHDQTRPLARRRPRHAWRPTPFEPKPFGFEATRAVLIA